MGCVGKTERIINKIRDGFGKAKHLLKPYWRQQNLESGINSTGFCYIGTEALFHLLGGLESGYKPRYYKYPNGDTHWWLYNEKTQSVLDPTFDQDEDVSQYYPLGKNAGFLTGYQKPSNNTKEFIKIIGIP